jgi:hypothetical protein
MKKKLKNKRIEAFASIRKIRFYLQQQQHSSFFAGFAFLTVFLAGILFPPFVIVLV